MVPIVNFTHSADVAAANLPEEYRALSQIPWRGPGCTGIVATTKDGTVSHARNLDFSPQDIMADLVYEGGERVVPERFGRACGTFLNRKRETGEERTTTDTAHRS